MGLQQFLLGQALKWKMKNVPDAQRKQIMELVQKNPELFKKIGAEVERRTKAGEPQMKASIEVMKKYRNELAKTMQG